MRSHINKRLGSVLSATMVLMFPTIRSNAEIGLGGGSARLATYDLEEFAEFGARPGTAFVTLRNEEFGITFGEKLVGQTNNSDGHFDVVGGTPSVPLTMDTSIDAVFGVNIISMFSSTVISGIGVLGFPDRNAIGEGALTVLYDTDQRVIAFDVVGANGGTINILFYSRSGALIDEVFVEDSHDTLYVFGGTDTNIAAVTFNNTDRGGLVFDNFWVDTGADESEVSCAITAPDVIERLGDVTSVVLEAETFPGVSVEAAGLMWNTNCPEGWFDDPFASMPTLSVRTTEECGVLCTVSLVIDRGELIDVCSKLLQFSGVGGTEGPGLSCPDAITVESDGTGNLDDLEAWMQEATSTDESLTNDYEGLEEGCGSTGSVTATWSIEADAGDCGAVGECSSTFTIVDTTPPVLELDDSPILVEDSTCAGEVFVSMPEAWATDAGDVDVEVTVDAPASFPAGETTTVTYLATDACGNESSASVDVTVLHGAGVEVYVSRRAVGPGRRGGVTNEPLSGVTVVACDASAGALGVTGTEHGDCTMANTAVTDEDGYALIDLPPGLYALVAQIDLDGDGVADEILTHSVGRLRCGKWKVRRFILLVDADGNPIHD